MSDTPDMVILHRDDRLIAVAKPAGMVVHRGWATDKETVYDVVRDRIVGSKIYGVHRLDRGTSGVLLFALDADAAEFVQNELNAARVSKRYLALVRGPLRDRLFVNHPIKQPPLGERAPAITEFVPVAHSGRWSLIEAKPITGRSHQIRLHLKHLSHPIIGAVRHGKGDINRLFREQYGFTRMALHAWQLKLNHPNGGEVAIEAPLPEDFVAILTALGIEPPR
jgi:tRNA pseudouridine65 synthase